jgi:hypothetical protein
VRRPWVVALLLGTVATPAAVILAVPAPRPLDAILAWPLVVMDRWVGPGIITTQESIHEGIPLRLAALAIGIVLTWVHYIVLARLVVWRMTARETDGA